MSTPEPGWHDDGHGNMRWWDGAQWTDHVAPVSPQPAIATEVSAPPSRERGPKRSLTWLAWAIPVGALAVAAIVAGTIMLWPTPASESAQEITEVSDAEQQRARDVLDDYNRAWETADCAAFINATASAFREPTGLADCSTFETQSENFAAATEDYAVEVTGVRKVDDGRVVVATTETFTAIADESGTSLDEPLDDVLSYEYIVDIDHEQPRIDGIRVVGEEVESSASASPEEDAPEVPDELLAPLMAYDTALVEADCELFESATTAELRQGYGVTDCDTFGVAVQQRASILESMFWVPLSSQAAGRGSTMVDVGAVLETHRNEYGQYVEVPVALDEQHRYRLVRSGGAWRVADIHDVSGDRVAGELLPEEEEAAEATMALWQQARRDLDCAAGENATTPAFREAMGWTDCASFAQLFIDLQGSCEAFDVHPEEMRFNSRINAAQGTMVVDVVEVCTQEVDDFGVAFDPVYEGGFPFRYTLIPTQAGWKMDSWSDGAAAEDVPSNENERSAIAAIRAYNDAWGQVDCDLYMDSSTALVRSDMEITDCATFETEAESFAASWVLTELVPTDTERRGVERMEIKVRESYAARFDSQGQPADPPLPTGDEYWVYTVEVDNGQWVVSGFESLL